MSSKSHPAWPASTAPILPLHCASRRFHAQVQWYNSAEICNAKCHFPWSTPRTFSLPFPHPQLSPSVHCNQASVPTVSLEFFPNVPKGPLTPDPWDRSIVPRGTGIYQPFLSTALPSILVLHPPLHVFHLPYCACSVLSRKVSNCLPPPWTVARQVPLCP